MFRLARFAAVKEQDDILKTILRMIPNGELVIEVPEVTRNNAFCIDCQFTWPQYIETRYLSPSEILAESEKRGTRAAFIEETEKMKEQRKKQGVFKRFIGNI